MEKEKIERINYLVKKSRDEGLTPLEKEEQRELREEYIMHFRRNLEATLDNTFIKRPDGTKEKLTRKLKS